MNIIEIIFYMKYLASDSRSNTVFRAMFPMVKLANFKMGSIPSHTLRVWRLMATIEDLQDVHNSQSVFFAYIQGSGDENAYNYII